MAGASSTRRAWEALPGGSNNLLHGKGDALSSDMWSPRDKIRTVGVAEFYPPAVPRPPGQLALGSQCRPPNHAAPWLSRHISGGWKTRAMCAILPVETSAAEAFVIRLPADSSLPVTSVLAV